MKINFESIATKQEITHRGGGMEISLNTFGYGGELMTAYQNYLGGGMLGRVANDCTVKNWKEDEKLVEIAEEFKKYFFTLTNPEEGEWEHLSYEQNQRLPISAY